MLGRRSIYHDEDRPEDYAGDLTVADLAALGCMKRLRGRDGRVRRSRVYSLDMLARVSAATCWIPGDGDSQP
jgi:hypothetical protein